VVNIQIAAATQADAEEMARTLNPFQSRLIISMGDKTLAECVARSFGGSTAMWAGRVNGELTAMWGVYPLEGGCGYPWLYSTSKISRYPRAALVIARHAIREMLAIYPRLYGVVDTRFDASVRFARHLGFAIGGYEVDAPFASIERTAHEWR